MSTSGRPGAGPANSSPPILEKVVNAAQGAVRLVKMNIDDHPEVAQQLRVQSIPAVFAFKNGQPVDAFQGALPESQIKQFIEKLAGEIGPSPADQLTDMGRETFAQGQVQEAAQMFAQALAAGSGARRRDCGPGPLLL